MLAEIRQAIAAALASRLDGVAQCSAYVIASPTPPAIHVFPASTTYDLAMTPTWTMGSSRAGTDQWQFTIQAFVAEMGDQAAQQLLDRFLEPSGGYSIKEAVEVDGTLGGLVADASITSMNGYTRYQVEGVTGPVLGAEWTVQILAG